MKYRLIGISKETLAHDADDVVSLWAEREIAPQVLSDFFPRSGGIEFGYAGARSAVSIEATGQSHAVLLKFSNGNSWRLASEAERTDNQDSPWRALPLKVGQFLSLSEDDHQSRRFEITVFGAEQPKRQS